MKYYSIYTKCYILYILYINQKNIYILEKRGGFPPLPPFTPIMTSIRKQVFEFLKIHPGISRKETKLNFKDCPKETVDRYYTDYNKTSKNIHLDIKTELIKIIKDYKQPASARVQAIREYNNLVENTPQEEEDPLLKLLMTLEKDTSGSPK